MSLRKLILTGAAAVALACPAWAETYTITASADYSGPTADAMPNTIAGIEAVIAWWNAEVGPSLDAEIKLKIYDMRYDAAVVAKTWPSILSSEKPVIHLGWGSVDLTTLMTRLPNDKVPLLMGTAMVGLAWKPDAWHFSVRPTYSHEFSGLFARLQEKQGSKLKIAAISTQTQAGFVDQVNGVKKLAEMYPEKFEVTSVQWAELAPVSLLPQTRAALKDDPDVLLVGGLTPQTIAALKALDELGSDIPLVASSHNGLSMVKDAVSGEVLEGNYNAFGVAAPDKADLPMRDVFEKYKKDGNWELTSAQSSAQAILAVRILENAIADAGAGNVDGQAMYDALMAHSYSEEDLLGVLPTVDFDTSAPFPVGDIRVAAQIFQDGKIVPLDETWLPVPALEKW